MPEHPRLGVGIVVTRGREVLLVHREGVHGSGTWSTPGGHLEFGEDLAECALREVREETGIDIRNPTFVGITNDVFESESKHYVTVWMEAEYVSGEATALAAYELTDVEWFPWDRLPSPLFFPLANLLAGRCHPRGASRLFG
jgi:8-oxo-dGTP diphosphatase